MKQFKNILMATIPVLVALLVWNLFGSKITGMLGK